MSVCQEIQLMGVSSQSWERAAAAAVREAVASFADHCIIRRVTTKGLTAPTFTTEVVKLDITLKATATLSTTALSSKFPFYR